MARGLGGHSWCNMNSFHSQRSKRLRSSRSGLCEPPSSRIVASARDFRRSAIALALTWTLAFLCGACRCRSGEPTGVMQDHPTASLIRDSDGSPAVLVWYVTGEEFGAPPMQVDAFYFAAWADGMVLHRPNFASEHLFLLHVDSDEICQTAQRLFSLVASVSKTDRRTIPPGEFDSTVQVMEKAGNVLLVRGESAPPNSTRERALHAIQTVVAHYLENFEGNPYVGDPGIRWIPRVADE